MVSALWKGALEHERDMKWCNERIETVSFDNVMRYVRTDINMLLVQ